MVVSGDDLYDLAHEVLDPAPVAVDGASFDVRVEEGFVIEPGSFHVQATLEDLEVPRDVALMVTGRSSHMRRGIYMPGGWVDPGYRSSDEEPFMLEFFNMSDDPQPVHDGEAGARLTAHRLDDEAAGYDGRWQG